MRVVAGGSCRVPLGHEGCDGVRHLRRAARRLPRAMQVQPEHRVRIEQPNGFEFAVAEVGRGWSTTRGPVSYELADTYGQFARIHDPEGNAIELWEPPA